jgi:hypothetical protein
LIDQHLIDQFDGGTAPQPMGNEIETLNKNPQ